MQDQFFLCQSELSNGPDIISSRMYGQFALDKIVDLKTDFYCGHLLSLSLALERVPRLRQFL